jgi:hypothetical protein
MATPIGGQQFSIDSSMDVPADGFNTAVVGSAMFIAAVEGDIIEISAGYDDAGTPVTVQHILGKVDEWQLNLTPEGQIVGRLVGRDKISELLDRQFKKLYLRTSPVPITPLGQIPLPPPPQLADVPYAVGTFLASEIAREIVTAAGLDLTWQCRDYEMLEDFDATGNSMDLIRRLVAPWSQVDRFKVDVFAQGNTIICRDRIATPTADYTFSILDSRLKSLSIRKRRTVKYKKVTLLGKLVPPGLFLGAVIYSPTNVTRTRSVQTFAPSGILLETVVTVELVRMPDNIPLEKTETTYKGDVGGTILKEEKVVTTYEDSIYTESGAVNQPRPLFEFVAHHGIHKKDPNKIFRVIRREERSWGYDTLDFLSVTTTKVFEFNPSIGTERQTQEIVATVRDLDHLRSEQVTSTYEVTTTGSLFLKTVATQIGAGLRPGGRRPPRTAGAAGTGGGEPLELEQTISTDVNAFDAQFSNRSMEQEDLDFIMDQFESASGNYEYELRMDLLAMPWIRKGNYLQLTGLLAEDGVTPIPLSPALVFEQRLNFDESNARAQMVTTLRCVFWSTT